MISRCCSLLISATVMTFLTLLIMPGCTAKQETPPPPGKRSVTPEKLTISYGGPIPSILAIAADQGFFTREGLDVTIKGALLGKNAFEEMLEGRSDLAILAETPVVIKSFTRDDIVILSSLRSSNNQQRIAARRDRGISTVAALKGRRIATVKGTTHHYLLDLVLAKNGLREKDIVPVFLESDQLEPALLDGSVDAIAATNLITFRSMKKLGEKGILLESPGLCLNYSLLVSTKTYINANPERITIFFRALQAASRFRQQFPDKSREIVMASQKLSRDEYDDVWSRYTDRLALDSALLLTLEEHATWVLQKGFVTGHRIPNYLDYIDADHLSKVDSEAVRLKR
jgi:sulfonate transport system substrate-binding protein